MIALALEDAGLKCTLHGSATFIAGYADATVNATAFLSLRAPFGAWQAFRGADYRDRIRPMQGLDLPKSPLLAGRAKKIHPPVARHGGAVGEHDPASKKASNFHGLTASSLVLRSIITALQWATDKPTNHRMTQR